MALPTSFGIEIEVNQRTRAVDDLRDLSSKFALAHIPWAVKLDGSCGRERGDKGVEVTSPILTRTEDFDQITQVVDFLEREGFTTNWRCGLHVHLGVQGTSSAARLRLIKFLVRYESAFFMLASDSRQSSVFCSKFHEEMINDFKRGRDAQSWQPRYHERRNPRYFWVNGTMSRFPTYEFRILESILDARYIIGWTSLLLMAYDHIVRHEKDFRWGRAKAKSAYILICTMLEQAGIYNKAIDANIRKLARQWALEQFDG